MPDAKNNAKLTGDTHLPEVEDDMRGGPEARPEGDGDEGTQEVENQARTGMPKNERKPGAGKDRG